LNKDKDTNFAIYVNSLLAAKRLEVCSTTIPQFSIPRIMGDPRYEGHLKRREATFEKRSDEAAKAFEGCEAVVVNKPGGAFYLTVMFKDGVLNQHQRLPIENPRIRKRIEELVKGVPPDKRFVYYLMGATGIVVVPLTGFCCTHEGFRVTLLETDDAKRAWIFKTLREAIDQYMAS
jgi:aspartate/methionine/tyrosine aminotransferase